MLTIGTCLCGYNALSVTPTGVDNIIGLKLSNGIYDDLYLTKDVKSEGTDLCPSEWDWNTIFHATFDDTTNAGNVDWSLKTVSHLLIKRKEKNSFQWTTLCVKRINTVEDFNIVGIDYTNASSTDYDYAVVPSLYGVEGVYSTAHVLSDFAGIFIAERDSIYGTFLTDGFCDTTRNVPSSIIPTVNNRYPVYVRNTISNYDTGSCNGAFMEFTTNCDIVTDNKKRISYQRDIMEFLSDGKPKLLKHFDGRMWLIEVTGNPTDTADGLYSNRKVNFEWTEIGDCRSEEDMYYANLTDVTEEWWNR